MANSSTKKPDDYVVATGVQYSIKQFINLTAKKLNLKIIWKGKGINEKGFNTNGFPIINVIRITLDHWMLILFG